MLAFWQTFGHFNIITNIVNKKMNKKALFFSQRGHIPATPNILIHKNEAVGVKRGDREDSENSIIF